MKKQRSKFYDWRRRYGKVNEHNCWIPRDFWLTEAETQALQRCNLPGIISRRRRMVVGDGNYTPAILFTSSKDHSELSYA